MRLAINLLTDDPDNPSGAHWFWTRVIPEISQRLRGDEELSLLVSPRSRPTHQGYGDHVRYITFPCSNELPTWRALEEQALFPVRLRAAGIDVLSTLLAPVVPSAPSLVVHFKTMHAYTAPEAIRLPNRAYRRALYPLTARRADAIVINSESLRDEVHRYLDVDDRKLRLIPEAVDHEVFRPGDPGESRTHVADTYGVRRPFVLFVSSLWPYKNAGGLIRAFASVRRQLDDRQLVLVGPGRDTEYVAELKTLAESLGVADDLVWVGGVPLEETAHFYRSADVFVYPSFNETFGLPILEAMACGCPVVTSDVSAMPETAGGAALLADPHDPESIGEAILKAVGPEEERLRAEGLTRAAEFSWARTAAATLDVYREAHLKRTGASRV